MSANLRTEVTHLIAECVIDNKAIQDIAECIFAKLSGHKEAGDLALCCRESEGDLASIALLTAALVEARRDGERQMLRRILEMTNSGDFAERDKTAIRGACFRVDPSLLRSLFEEQTKASAANA